MVVRRLWGHRESVSNGVFSQSIERTSWPISPAPARKFPSPGGPADAVGRRSVAMTMASLARSVDTDAANEQTTPRSARDGGAPVPASHSVQPLPEPSLPLHGTSARFQSISVGSIDVTFGFLAIFDSACARPCERRRTDLQVPWWRRPSKRHASAARPFAAARRISLGMQAPRDPRICPFSLHGAQRSTRALRNRAALCPRFAFQA